MKGKKILALSLRCFYRQRFADGGFCSRITGACAGKVRAVRRHENFRRCNGLLRRKDMARDRLRQRQHHCWQRRFLAIRNMIPAVTLGNAYGTSTLKTAIEAIAAGFSSGEQSAVIPRTLNGGSANFGVREGGVYHDDHISGDPVENALLWPLSFAEANSLDNELRKADPANPDWLSSFWWLRSPGYDGNYAACVSGDGGVLVSGYGVTSNDVGFRPAFYVNPESVLFTSAAVGANLPAA